MRKPSDEQVQGWIAACVYYERTRLPGDHPRYLPYWGRVLSEIRRTATNASTRLASHDLYDPEDIKRRAWGDVDLDKVRAEQKAVEDGRVLRNRVRAAVDDATAEQLQAALVALEAQA